MTAKIDPTYFQDVADKLGLRDPSYVEKDLCCTTYKRIIQH